VFICRKEERLRRPKLRREVQEILNHGHRESIKASTRCGAIGRAYTKYGALSKVEKIRNLSVLVGLRKIGDLRR
jgi:hypothetical protein